MTTAVHGTPMPPTGTAPARVRVRVRGIASLVAAGLLLVGAYVSGWSDLLILGCFAALPTLLSMLYLLRLRPKLVVTRQVVPELLAAGQAGTVRVNIANAGLRRLPASHCFELLPWPPGSSPRAAIPLLQPGKTAVMRYAISPPNRGVLEIGPTFVEQSDPFGLVSLVARQDGRQRVIVGPTLHEFDRMSSAIASDSGSADLFQHRSLAGEHDLMTRDWRPGDALRTVHWRASAHHGQLMVREEEHQSHSQAIVVLETMRAAYPDASRTLDTRQVESTLFEGALSLACSLRRYLIGEGLSVRISETGPRQLAERGLDFAESAARIRLATTRAGSSPLEGGAGLCFVVVPRLDAELRGMLLEASGRFERCVLFLLDSDGSTEDRLETAGWVVVTPPRGATAREAWTHLIDRLHPVNPARTSA